MFVAGMKFALGLVIGLFMAAAFLLGLLGMLEWALDLRRRHQPEPAPEQERETPPVLPFVMPNARTVSGRSAPTSRIAGHWNRVFPQEGKRT